MDWQEYCCHGTYHDIQLNTPKMNLDLSNIREPLYNIDELNSIVSPDLKKTYDVRQVLARILDAS